MCSTPDFLVPDCPVLSFLDAAADKMSSADSALAETEFSSSGTISLEMNNSVRSGESSVGGAEDLFHNDSFANELKMAITAADPRESSPTSPRDRADKKTGKNMAHTEKKDDLPRRLSYSSAEVSRSTVRASFNGRKKYIRS